MIMVYAETVVVSATATAIRVFTVANSTAASLHCKEFVVLVRCDPVHPVEDVLPLIVACPNRIGGTPELLFLSELLTAFWGIMFMP